MIEANILEDVQIHQGDIFQEVDCIEQAEIVDMKYVIRKIRYNYVVVMTQECDLLQDHNERHREDGDERRPNDDKILESVIVVPLYNYEHFRFGTHLSNLGKQMNANYQKTTGSTATTLFQNNNPRYHFLDFIPDIPIVKSVMDFKHYFTVNLENLYFHKSKKYCCSIDPLYREQISQRFAAYLSRIGLPDNRDS